MKYSYCLLIALSLATSCGVYQTQSTDIPLINHKNDLRIDAGVSAALTNGSATISYGLTDNIAAQVYGNIGAENRYYYQGAMGWYKKLEKKHVMEVYAGVGNGYGFFRNHDSGMKYSGNYQLYFFQYNYGIVGEENGIWDLGFGIKTGMLHSNILTEYDPNRLGYQAPVTNIDNNLLIEPTLFLRVGGKHLKFGIKGGATYIPDLSNCGTLPYFPINISAGLNYRL